ncbi:MFS transporter [Pseudoduganella umbonata]|uniref:Putative tartrate transporter n=1 Tax=Pseudoduganella umbonata TaxID=864828 RepID=A0A4P8HXJ9_9BURK|nr:MFS transporter [Pseudoduganella umbonata]MBB3223090.1 D-galactonate transporter [Pseudoduganella umbonata]QCP13185.1 MFS transporter [Pseudoduganella umbonata]
MSTDTSGIAGALAGTTAQPDEQSRQPCTEQAAVYRKVNLRLIPFLFICYVAAYLDRINIGFAQLQMKADLGFSDAVYGLGAGIFFFGYALFEVPSNLLLEKIGARKTLLRIMVLWGLTSAGMMFITTPTQLYIARFLLGLFEAGFFPGIILYFTYWYPSGMRARIIALFMSGMAVAGIIGGPLSGWIMNDMAGVNGWAGWQWMFLLEGLPAVLLGVLAWFVLQDRPRDASWLSARDKEVIESTLQQDRQALGPAHHGSLRDAMRDPKIYILAFAYFTFIAGTYVITFWLPAIVKSFGVSDPLRIGLLTAIPYIIGAIGMVVLGKSSDRTRERRWHAAGAAFLGGAALVVSTLVPGNLTLALVALSFAAIGILATMPLFWAMPAAYLSGPAAAGGIALINSLGLVGGFVSPFVIGWFKTTTGSVDGGLYFVAAMMVLGAIVLLVGIPAKSLREKRTG